MAYFEENIENLQAFVAKRHDSDQCKQVSSSMVCLKSGAATPPKGDNFQSLKMSRNFQGGCHELA